MISMTRHTSTRSTLLRCFCPPGVAPEVLGLPDTVRCVDLLSRGVLVRPGSPPRFSAYPTQFDVLSTMAASDSRGEVGLRRSVCC